MDHNKLFANTRWRLAGWYAGVMSIVLGLCGLGLYEAIAHAHRTTLDRELEAVAGTLHDSIEPVPKQPERLKQLVQQLPAETCQNKADCLTEAAQEKRHVLGAIHQGDYYLRLIDSSGRTIARAGLQPEALPSTPREERWQVLKDRQGNRHHQISLSLHTQDNLPWGYMQVGRSLSDVDGYLAAVRLILLLGLPIAFILVGGSSWWLAGLAMQPIYRSYQQMQQFTADVAHELRTPLATTQATIESALRLNSLPEPEAWDILQAIERQNHRLAQLVKDLLLLSHSDQQALTAQRQPCCLNDLISDLVEEFAALAIKADVTLTAKVQLQKNLYVLGDEEQLYRLVSNLIVNAIQHTPPAGGQVTVVLDCSSHSALIQVQDTGIGIALKDQTRIFDRFYRVSSDRSRQTGGAGLGLSIARAIAQAHHGSIQVQSQHDPQAGTPGSTFTVRLPLYDRT